MTGWRPTPKRERPEDALQIRIFDELRVRVPAPPRGPLLFHVPNGGHRTKAEGGIFKAMGTHAGASDIIGLYRGRPIAIELKAPNRKPIPSELQAAFQELWKAAGGAATTVNSVEGFFDFLAELGVPVRRAVTWGG